jgi:hypothetical protein
MERRRGENAANGVGDLPHRGMQNGAARDVGEIVGPGMVQPDPETVRV